MSVATVKTALAAIQKNILNILAFAEGPVSLSSMPCMVNFTGPAQYDGTQSDAIETTRRYIMRLFVREVGQGIDGEAERLAEPWFPAVLNAFAARPRLGNTAFVKRSRIVSDSGLQVSVYAGVQYLAIDFNIEVVEWNEVTYAE